MYQTTRHLDPQTLAPATDKLAKNGATVSSDPASANPGPVRRRGSSGIQRRLLLTLLGIGAATLVLVGTLAYFLSERALREERFGQLRVLRNILAENVNSYFRRTRAQVAASSSSDRARTALGEFSTARRGLIAELEANGFRVDNAFLSTALAANRDYYRDTFAARLAQVRGKALETAEIERWLPRGTEANLIQYVYVTRNPLLDGARYRPANVADIIANEQLPSAFRLAFAKTSYAQAVERHDEFFRTLAERSAWEDVLLADAAGEIVYSLLKELDLGANLRTDAISNTNLGHVFTGAWYAPAGAGGGREEDVVTTDFSAYPYAADSAALFMAGPINTAAAASGNSSPAARRAGALLCRLSTQSINDLLSQNGHLEEAGLGTTGFAYMIGGDFLMRTEARNLAEVPAKWKKPKLDRRGQPAGETTVLKWEAKNSPSQAIFANAATFEGHPAGKGEMTYKNSLGYEVMGAYGPLNINGIDAGLVVRIAAAEAFAPLYRLRNILLLGGGTLLLGLALVATLLARSFARPINGLANAATAIAGGDNTVRAPVESRDEIGQAATQFNAMVEARLAAQAHAEEENVLLQKDIRELLTVVSDAADGDMTVRAKVTEGALGNVADAFNLMAENIGDLLQQVQAAAARVDRAAGGMKGSAETLAAGATEQAGHIGNTTEALHQMSANLQVVSLNAEAANGAANEAARAAETGNAAVAEVMEGMERIRRSVQSSAKKIKRLGERSMEISTILGTIQAISAQTDMLALNASIEAARAGEEGRGFTIVAEEVRKLSERTAQATKEIERLVAAIQTDTGEAVTGMEGQIAEVERESTSVSGAGTELERIRHTITESALLIGAIHEASKEQAQGAVQIVDFMTEVRTIAQQAQTGSEQTKTASTELSGLAGQLTGAVGKFKVAAPDAPDAPTSPAEVPVQGLTAVPVQALSEPVTAARHGHHIPA